MLCKSKPGKVDLLRNVLGEIDRIFEENITTTSLVGVLCPESVKEFHTYRLAVFNEFRDQTETGPDLYFWDGVAARWQVIATLGLSKGGQMTSAGVPLLTPKWVDVIIKCMQEVPLAIMEVSIFQLIDYRRYGCIP